MYSFVFSDFAPVWKEYRRLLISQRNVFRRRERITSLKIDALGLYSNQRRTQKHEKEKHIKQNSDDTNNSNAGERVHHDRKCGSISST